jgi:hypothetical protein
MPNFVNQQVPFGYLSILKAENQFLKLLTLLFTQQDSHTQKIKKTEVCH